MRRRRLKRKRRARRLIAAACSVLVLIGAVFMIKYHFGEKTYTAEDFDIQTVYSTVDFNGNGADDYTDIVRGARKDVANKPAYDGRYFGDGGYPPDEIGVCTDVVWRAFKNAGYCLRDMVDNDIEKRPAVYTEITARDKNIDFRRVGNLHVFFEKYAVSLTLEITDIAAWQPGDLVIFGNDKHIGIVSDKRNAAGQPYILHNGGAGDFEADYLPGSTVTGHYRFDASRLGSGELVKWDE